VAEEGGRQVGDELKVIWLDAVESEWIGFEDAVRKPDNSYTVNYGCYLHEDDEFIYISSSHGADIYKHDLERWAIPKGTIKEMIIIKKSASLCVRERVNVNNTTDTTGHSQSGCGLLGDTQQD